MAASKARWIAFVSWLLLHTMPTAVSLNTLSNDRAINGLQSLSSKAGTTWAQYSFENSLSDTSGNGRDFVSGSSWSPTYAGGVVGMAVHLDAPSGVNADNSNSWLQGPVISSADVSGQSFEISFNLALVSSGFYHAEWLLTFTSQSDTTNTVVLLKKSHGNGAIEFVPSTTGQSTSHAIDVLTPFDNVWTGAWHTVKLSTDDPCSNNATWALEFDGQTYSYGPVDSICDREMLFNRHCWVHENQHKCSSRINMKIDELVITSGTASPTASPTVSPTASPTASPTPGSQAASAKGDPHLQNIYGQRFDLMKEGKHVLINIPRGASAGGALLRVQAESRRLGGHCKDMYFRAVNITGSWALTKESAGFQYEAGRAVSQTPKWLTFGKVHLKIVHGRTQSGIVYLNVYAKHLGQAGSRVGGLLGEDDHSAEATPPTACSTGLNLQKEWQLNGLQSATAGGLPSMGMATFA